MTSPRKDGTRARDRPRSGPLRPSPARAASFEVLTRVEARRGEPASLLHHERYRFLSRADRDLATEITLGVLRQRARLDWILAHHSTRPLDSLEPALLRALRIGLYQILYLDRVPDRAAVDESVRLARAFGAGRGAGLVNAVLRGALRSPDVPRFPDRERDPVGYLSVTLSHPRWLASRYLARLGIDGAEARCRIQNEPPSTHVRVSARIGVAEARESLAREGIDAEPLETVPSALVLRRGPGTATATATDTALFRDGLLFPQDAGSQLVPWLLDLRAGDRVLDVCAAPGGKATAIAERVSGGTVFAIDLRARRVRVLVDVAQRLGASNVAAAVADGARLPFRSEFERILVDAPCTSVGTLRRNPDVKWRVVEADLPRLAETQYRILSSACERLAPGGRLVYATCSTEPEENEEIVERALAGLAGLALVDARSSLPECARHLACSGGFFRTRPERDGMDGYFGAVITRTGMGRKGSESR
jgi:16S rRNA (cytosine967-C5)-methyltransferase